ncbi:MAG: phage portal protein [Candidatus Caldarchaeum sp.]|nr:phage portal protein [Candidatus Caldarchaeum sp.]MDW8434803.1 phage portal protein [Candidatus Caldarchaeum sp.]
MSFIKKLVSKPKALASTMTSFYGKTGEPKPLDPLKLLELAEGDTDVRACLDAVVDAVTANGWYVMGDDVSRVVVEEWLKEREDEFYLFLRNLVLTTLIFDECYVECVSGFPRVVAPWTMQVVRDEYGVVSGYVQQTTKTVRFSTDEIVHVVLHPLADRSYGTPKIASLARILLAKREAELFLFQIFVRKGVLSKAIVLKHGDETTFNKLKRVLEEAKPGDNLLLMGEIDVKTLSQPVEDLRVVELLNEFRQRILAVFRVPPIVYGVIEGLNLETSRNQMTTFAQYVKSLQKIFGAAVTLSLKRILGVDGFVFRLVEWMNPEQETAIHVSRVQAGIETVDEARRAMGLPSLKGGQI